MIIHRSSEFKKKFVRSSQRMRDKIGERLKLFMADEFDHILNNHALHGEYVGFRSFDVTGDVRVIYKSIDKENRILVRFGTHHQLYGK